MTRKLPWQTAPSVSHAKRPPSTPRPTPKPASKRLRIENQVSDADTNRETSSPRRARGGSKVRTPSSSPPPALPEESFMVEGMEHDDRYRMVEDEFLTVAKRFTVHIHAAGYKRQQKIVRERNAKAISSISRPVTGKMPDHTKRKIVSVARSNAQGNAIQSLLLRAGNPVDADSDDSDDGDPLPYVGTTLHSLMDSPQRKAASLERLRKGAVATRAAAGFKRPSETKSPRKPICDISTSRADVPNPQPSIELNSTKTSDDDDNDDLDAPIPAPKLSSMVPAKTSTANVIGSSRSTMTNSAQDLKQSTGSKSHAFTSRLPVDQASVPKLNSTYSDRRSTSPDLDSRIAKRLEQARMQRAKREEAEKKKRLDVIPTFL